jgi:threonine synthase
LDHVLGFKCSLCGQEYGLNEIEYVCPKHGDMGNVEIVYDTRKVARGMSTRKLAQDRDYSIWRYRALLPIAPDSPALPLQIGWTPLYRSQRLCDHLKMPNLYIKDDGRNPTASFKDRASAIAVVKARELERKIITTASSGNAGAALAGMAASVGQPAVIFVPQTAPEAKVAQLLMFGALVLLVKGTYDDAFDLCLQASREFGWYCRNTGYNPYTLEGKKTAALEICEQLGWKAPDRIFVSVGDGNIISGIHKGLKDLLALGMIDKLPKLMGVQAAGSAACYNAWRHHTEKITPVDAQTIADSISVGLPRDGVRAVRAASHTSGAYLTVTDDEILDAMRVLARRAAVFAEPAGATAYAGLVKAVQRGMVRHDETVVVLITGNGLKDIKSAIKAAGHAQRIEPNLDDLKRWWNKVTTRAV